MKEPTIWPLRPPWPPLPLSEPDMKAFLPPLGDRKVSPVPEKPPPSKLVIDTVEAEGAPKFTPTAIWPAAE